jgi:class 3 adenylate cyclase
MVGHRRKLLNAIALLRVGADAQAPTPSTKPLTTAPIAAASTPEAAGERRHVVVMFCDLVDSTGIAAKLDAEEWRDLVGAYLEAASTAVTEMGGILPSLSRTFALAQRATMGPALPNANVLWRACARPGAGGMIALKLPTRRAAPWPPSDRVCRSPQ